MEARRLLTGAPVVLINEFVAVNNNGLIDSFGERSDWIELHNASPDSVNLLGWRLTDVANDANPWVFPARTIPAGGYLVVFANERNTTPASGELGTDFNLDGNNGEYLGLLRPDGSVAHHFAPRFPAQLGDVSYGLPAGAITTVPEPLIDEVAAGKVLVPANDSLGLGWTSPAFVDSSWLDADAPVGFDANGTGENYGSLIETNLQSAMLNQRPGAYVRLAFQVEDPSRLTSLTLRMRYDDGFVAYLNGQVIAQRNAPGSPTANSTATGPRADADALVFEDINVNQHLSRLTAGTNVLAIHALNTSAADTDFLLGPMLVADVRTDPEPRYFTTPTPGAANSGSGQGLVADTKFSVDRGFFDAPFQVAITTATPGAEIRYTTDGSPPTATTGTLYTGPITISGTTTLRAAAYKPGFLPTAVDAQTYIFLDQVLRQSNTTVPPHVVWGHHGPDFTMDPLIVNDPRYAGTIKDDLKAIPSLNISMPWNNWFGNGGIYIAGSGIERAAAVEWINPDGKPGFEITGSVEIQGGSSVTRWKNDKLSMRLTFKQPYGPTKLNYGVFDGSPFSEGVVDSFDTLILDAILGHGWTHPEKIQDDAAKFVTDQFVAGMQNAMSGPGSAPHETWVHLYLNGVYWGMYHAHERPDSTFQSDYFGGRKEDWDVIKHTPGDVVDGTNARYNELLSKVRLNQADPANYEAVARMLDMQHFADYMILNFWGGNEDWAHHNWYAAFNRADPNGKWRFHSWDAEHVLKLVTRNVTLDNETGSPTEIHTRLRANPEYRLLFADRVHKHLFNDGNLTPQKAADAWRLLMTNIDRAVVGESARWGDNRIQNTGRRYTRDDWYNWQQTNLLAPGAYFDRRTGIVLDQLRATSVYPTINAPVFSQHGGTVSPGFSLTMSQNNGAQAGIFYTLDGSDPRLPGGARSPSALSYTGPVTIDRSTTVKARAFNFASAGWSALNQAVFAAGVSDLRVTEVNYNPHPSGAPFTDSDDFEFVEVRNVGPATLNLKDAQFTDGIEFTFPDVDLAAGESGVIVRNAAAFRWRYGTSARVLGSYGGEASNNLSNGGETLRLADAAGTTILAFTYDDDPEASWHAATDGQGRSLTVVNPAVAAGPAWSMAGHWRASRTLGGTPGADESAGAGVAVTGASFDHAAMPHRLRFTFDRDVAGSFTAEDVTVRDLATGATATPSAFAYDAGTRTATLTFDGGLSNGDWRAAIPALATADGGPGALPRDFVLSFFCLAGDINRDRSVNGTDFGILASNFGRTGMSFGLGDLNGDGSVNGTDFAMLAGNFGRSLPAIPPAAVLAETSVSARAAVSAPPSAPAASPAPKPVPSRRPAPTSRRKAPPAPARRLPIRHKAPARRPLV